MNFPLLESFDLGATMDGCDAVIIHDPCGDSKTVENLKEAVEWAVEHLQMGCK